ncbi:MAG: helix-turn-helix domain-containing protein [Anaerolineaceae bacterium]|nr:helix-turn-helix domain-containing protein [Anaerolineaceae bacterium]
MTTAHTTLSAKEAVEQLGISLATLYAYVSRGADSFSGAGFDDSRQRRYSAADVEALLKT